MTGFRSPRLRRRLEALISYVGLSLGAVFLGLPFYWMAITALKSVQETALYPPTWLPHSVRWENFADVWTAAPFARYTLNSLVVSLSGCLLQVLFALFMAYAFAYLRFPGKSVLFVCVLATLIVPDEVRLVPNYMTLKRLAWINTYQGLILPGVANAFPVFVLVQWFRSLPHELIEAARVDGAGHLRTLFWVVVPSSKTVLGVLAAFSFANRWNEYLWPLIATNRSVMRTLPVGLAYFRGSQEVSARWDLLMAAALMAALPVLAAFLLVQRPLTDEVMKTIRRRQT